MKTKKKLKDITRKEYAKWKGENCYFHIQCDFCPFKSVRCDTSEKSWVDNKELFSKQFLNKEIEIEIEIEETNILDEKEKQYLENIIRPLQNIVKNISKRRMRSNYEYISICVSVPADIGYYCTRNYINFPYFKKGTMYKNMEARREYSLEELGLFLEEE